MKNQGEIITLIVFVILTLALGVTTYFGFDGMTKQKAELATAQSEFQNVTTANYTLAQEYAAVKERAGFAPALKGADVVAAMDADLEGLKTDLGVAATTYKDAVAELKKGLASGDAEIKRLADARDSQIQSAKDAIEKSAQQQKAFVENVANLQSQQEQALTTARGDFNSITEQFVDQTKSFDSVNRQARDAVVEARAETAKNREIANRYADVNIDLSRRIDEISNPIIDRADGSVVYADQIAKVVRLDVGDADGVRPLMTLSVYPPEFFEEGGVSSKGKVQILRTIEEHSCEAKILEDVSANPIQPGDLVYTSFWKPGDRESFALDCRLDVNGDSYSDLEELINLIESNGFKVAAYIDDLGKVHGKITPEVTRVVVPNKPLAATLAADPELGDDARQAILDAETQFLDDAKANGVREMRLTDFLIRMDYKDTDQVKRDAKSPYETDPASVEVSNEPVAPIFNSATPSAESSSKGVKRGASATSSDDDSDSVERYFRKRSPVL